MGRPSPGEQSLDTMSPKRSGNDDDNDDDDDDNMV